MIKIFNTIIIFFILLKFLNSQQINFPNECNETQADIIESLGREVIVVADRDRAGARMINNAIEYGWSVSFPVWLETCKDVNEAVVKYGKLFVLKTILDSKQTSKLKIELMKKRLYA